MKRNLRTVYLALIIITVVALSLLIVSCKGEDNPNPPVPEGDYLDDVPKDVDFNQEEVNIIYWDQEFVNWELIADDNSSDSVNVAVYERNVSVEDRLNVKLNFIKGEIAPEIFLPQVQEYILSGTDDFDIIDGVQCQTGILAVAGYYRDMSNTKYLNFDKEYWNKEYMDQLSVGKDRVFLMGGDITLTTTAWASAMLFDKGLYTDLFENEYGDVDSFYSMVEEYGWTIDKMGEYCRGAYQDLNGNALRDNKDQFGVGIGLGGSVVDQFCFSAGVKYSTRDENNLPVLDMKNEKAIEFTDTFNRFLFENTGVWAYSNSNAPDDDDSRRGLFHPARMDALRESRDQEISFGVIPYPMLNENQKKYHSWISDNTNVFSVPVTLSDDKMDMVSAVLEVMASETKRVVLPIYYESALKGKYVQDNPSARMLDLIHDGVTTDFAVVYAMSLDGIGYIMRGIFSPDSSPGLISTVDAKETAVQAKLKTLIDAYVDNLDQPAITTTSKDTEPASGDSSETTKGPDSIAANTISSSWQVFGSKFRSSGVLIKPDLSEKFSYTTNDKNEIEVRSPSNEALGGYNPTAAIQSLNKVPLKDLTAEFKIDEGFSFAKVNGEGYAPALSLSWTNTPIAGIPKYIDAVGTNAFREAIPTEVEAFALTVAFMGTGAEHGSTIANYIYIILHDGTDPVAEGDRRVGLRWTIKTDTDLGQPVKVEVKEDEELGYIVLVNGVAYREGTRGDQTLPIDLKPLRDIPEGHILLGGETPDSIDFANFTLMTINGKPAGTFFD